ncbi:aminopeptidase P family N-terminal domain-containing protein [Candidatus Poriferisocius sp.]|uniref:aminopeptidase P family N-terminal domain-containing protein n=1 Tax=Candidatus Poriferisocius sp. TaxID=3101276 RepID=UPI003B528BD2
MSLHLQRRARAIDALDAAGIDFLVAGRQDHINYFTGAHQLWTAGARPFGPVCTLNVATDEIFLLSTWDEGVPDDIDLDHLHGITWSGAIIYQRLAATPGIAEANRVGIDAWSPGMAGLLSAVAPKAEIVPADDILAQARRIKLPSEVDAIRASCAVAAAGVTAAVAHPGTDAQRLAAGVEAMALAGSSTPAAEPRVEGPVVDFSCIRWHYEGGLGRTANGDPELTAGLIAACVPGAAAEDLRRAAPDGQWLVRGCGMGYEPPVINTRYGKGEVLEADTVLSVGASIGADHRRDIVLVTETTPEILSLETA